MKISILLRSVLAAALCGTLSPARAVETPAHTQVELSYDILEPTLDMARHIQKKGDYATAALVYETILKRDPSNVQVLRRMVECHEALAREEKKEKPVQIPQADLKEDTSLTDLPDLIPADSKNAQQPLAHPKNSLL